jgi:hypothetical protein
MILTAEQTDLIINSARAFNEKAITAKEEHHAPKPSKPNEGAKPGEDFDTRTSWFEVLEPHGWEALRTIGDKTYWRRPGKKDGGISATTGHCGSKLYVFSSNAQPFDAERAYNKFSAYGLLNCGGDFSVAARELRAKGFGAVREPMHKPSPSKWVELNEGLERINGQPSVNAPMPDDRDAPPETPERLTAEELERLIDNDRRSPLLPGVFGRLLAARDQRAEWLGILDLLRRKKLKRDVESAIKEHDRRVAIDQHNADADVTMRDALATFGAFPVSGDPQLPSDYVLHGKVPLGAIRLFRVDIRETKDGPIARHVAVCDRVPIVSAILHHRNGTQEIELAWPSRRGSGWAKRAVPAEQGLDASKMPILCAYGFPVTSENRRELVRWIDSYMRTNEHQIDHRQVSETCGYQKDGGFVLGQNFIGDEEKRVDFAASGDGELQLVEGLSKKSGTMGEWRNMLRSIHAFPRLELALYASLAAPLLKPLGASNFAVEWAGKTSGGKTTALRLAASVWGENSESEDSSLLQNWSATQTGIERYMATMTDLPTLIDETQSAEVRFGKRPILESTIYSITGQGKMRGAKTGSRATAKWRTVLLTTGEQKLSDLMQGGGAAARVLSVWGSPTDGMTGAEVARLKSQMAANCGHAGEAWVTFILEHKADWPKWRQRHAELQDEYAAQMSDLPDQNVVGRMAACMAVLGIAAELAIDALDLPWGIDEFSSVQRCVEYFAREISQISRPRKALEDLADYLGARQSQILGSSQSSIDKPPATGWLARLPKGIDTDGSLGVFIDPLKRILEQLGYAPNSIVRQWCESGVIEKQQDGYRAKARLVGGDRGSCYKIPLSLLSSAGLDLEEIGPSNGHDKHAQNGFGFG